MIHAIVVTGRMTDAQTVALDEHLPLGGRVRLVVESLESPQSTLNLEHYLEGLRQRQADRGHVPMTREQIDRMVAEERAGWDERS